MATKTFKIGLSNTDKQNMAQDVYERLLALTFPEYDTGIEYSVGDFVVYNDQLYKCIGSTSGAWDSTKWQLATLNDLVSDIEDAVQFVNDKANVDGNYPTMTAGLADNLTPYGEDSGAEQDEPFISNGTGTNNNTEIVTVGDYGLLKEKQGHTLVVNQINSNPNFSSTSSWNAVNGTLSASSNILTYTISEIGTQPYSNPIYQQNYQRMVAGHTYLLIASVKSSKAFLTGLTITNATLVKRDYKALTSSFSTFYAIYTVSSINYNSVQLQPDVRTLGEVGDTVDIKEFYTIDLTQMFNGDIQDDLIENPSHFSWYYNGSLAYNAGSLVNANGVKLVSTGRNLWEEEWELGVYSDGVKISDNNYIRSKNQLVVTPNKTYYYYVGSNVVDTYIVAVFYDKDGNWIGNITVNKNSTFATPQNACYMAFYVNNSYGTSYNNDITISPYYTPEEGGKGYEEYYPYEEPYIVDTGNEVLRQAGSVKDYKEPNGTVYRLVDEYTFTGSESWAFDSEGNHFYCTLPISASEGQDYEDKLCSNGIKVNIINNNILRVYLVDNPQLSSSSNMNTIFASGTKLNYPLATPTTEQGTTFSENIKINDYGMLYWLDSSNNLVGIPQGAKIFFPTNYKGFVDDLYSKVNGNSDDYALNSELNAKFGTYLKSLSGYDATATQVLKNVEGTLTWVTEE